MRGGKSGSRSPKRVSGDGSAPPRFLVAVNFAFRRLAFATRPFCSVTSPLPKKSLLCKSFSGALFAWFSVLFLLSFPWRVLGCGARARSAKVCGAATAAPQCLKAALVYAKHTPWCQTVKISEFIIVLPIIFLDRISSI